MEYPNLTRTTAAMLSIPTVPAETERSLRRAGKMVSP
jgi:hypothetical protein